MMPNKLGFDCSKRLHVHWLTTAPQTLHLQAAAQLWMTTPCLRPFCANQPPVH